MHKKPQWDYCEHSMRGMRGAGHCLTPLVETRTRKIPSSHWYCLSQTGWLPSLRRPCLIMLFSFILFSTTTQRWYERICLLPSHCHRCIEFADTDQQGWSVWLVVLVIWNNGAVFVLLSRILAFMYWHWISKNHSNIILYGMLLTTIKHSQDKSALSSCLTTVINKIIQRGSAGVITPMIIKALKVWGCVMFLIINTAYH